MFDIFTNTPLNVISFTTAPIFKLFAKFHFDTSYKIMPSICEWIDHWIVLLETPSYYLHLLQIYNNFYK